MRKLPLALALTMILSGCMLGPDYARPDLPLPEQFAQVDAEGLNRGDALAHYWDAFPDALLKELIAEALAANHDLRIAHGGCGVLRERHHHHQWSRQPSRHPVKPKRDPELAEF